MQNELYLFQYPLRPKSSKNELNIRNCFFKPNNQEVKLEADINMESSNFDTFKAEMIANEINDSPEVRKKEKEAIFESGIVDKVLFSSSKVVDDVDKYAIAVFNGREFHLTALKGRYPHSFCSHTYGWRCNVCIKQFLIRYDSTETRFYIYG